MPSHGFLAWTRTPPLCPLPGVVLPKPDYGAMEAALKDACATHNLQPTDYFLLKVTPQPPHSTWPVGKPSKLAHVLLLNTPPLSMKQAVCRRHGR